MPKRYTVNIGGKERLLQFKVRDAIELKNRFHKPVMTLLRDDVLGLVPVLGPDGRPETDANGGEKFKTGGPTDPEVQAALIFYGLRRADSIKRTETEGEVMDWIDAHIEGGGVIGDLVMPAVKAAYASAMLGVSIDVEALTEGDEGKAQDQPTTS